MNRNHQHGHDVQPSGPSVASIGGLVSEELIDCQGRTTHRLVLEIDGTISVRFVERGVTARIDPRSGTVLTPGVHVPPQVMNAAASMRVG